MFMGALSAILEINREESALKKILNKTFFFVSRDISDGQFMGILQKTKRADLQEKIALFVREVALIDAQLLVN